MRRGLSGRLHPSNARRARLRGRRAAVHRSRRVHRLRRVRRGLPGGRLLRRGPAPRRVDQVHRDQLRLLLEVVSRRSRATALAIRLEVRRIAGSWPDAGSEKPLK